MSFENVQLALYQTGHDVCNRGRQAAYLHCTDVWHMRSKSIYLSCENKFSAIKRYVTNCPIQTDCHWGNWQFTISIPNHLQDTECSAQNSLYIWTWEKEIVTEKMQRTSLQSAFPSWQCNTSGNLHLPAMLWGQVGANEVYYISYNRCFHKK